MRMDCLRYNNQELQKTDISIANMGNTLTERSAIETHGHGGKYKYSMYYLRREGRKQFADFSTGYQLIQVSHIVVSIINVENIRLL
jgi:hypothetical protein